MLGDHLRALNAITSSRRLLQPEQAIQTALLPLTGLIPTCDQDSLRELESALISLLHVNNGLMTAQCSCAIGHCLLQVYRRDPKSNFWALLSDATDKATAANIFAVKCVISKLGSTCRNSLTSTAERFLAVKDPNLVYPVLVALPTLFKICTTNLAKHASSAFSFLTKPYKSGSEAVQIAAIRLASRLIGYRSVSDRQILKFAGLAFSSAASQFVITVTSEYVARFAASQLRQENSGKSSGSKSPKQIGLDTAFSTLTQFRQS
jgi:hypothetical protein